MTDAYVDFTAGNDANSGVDWANAEATIQAGMTDAGAGGRVFVQIDTADVATTKDTAASARTLTTSTTDTDPMMIYGVKNGTTAEPPTDSDLVIRGTDTLPVFEITGAGNDLTLSGHAHCYGIDFQIADSIPHATNSNWVMEQCRVQWAGSWLPNNDSEQVKMVNCDLAPSNAAAIINISAGGIFDIYGGLFSGTAMTTLLGSAADGQVIIQACDMSNLANTTFLLANVDGARLKIMNCKMPATFTLMGGAPDSPRAFVEIISSSNETGLGSTDSVQNYQSQSQQGTCDDEPTAVRSGGADDGADGSFAYKLVPTVNATREGARSVFTPWFGVWVAGDGSTSKTFTAFIANDSGSDINQDDAYLELYFPDVGGAAAHNLDYGTRDFIGGGANVIADDAVSSWTAPASNPQKLQVTATPDFQGFAYGRVHFAKRYAASPDALYVDPKLDVA